MWNGIDVGVTSAFVLPKGGMTALQTYLQSQIFFGNDTLGGSLNDGSNKILCLPGNKAPYRNAVGSNGSFVFCIAPENVPTSVGAITNNRVASLYYFGSLDQENPPGLYRLMRYSTSLSGGFVYNNPVNTLVNNSYTTSEPGTNYDETIASGVHYFSTLDMSQSSFATHLYEFSLTTNSGLFAIIPKRSVRDTNTAFLAENNR